MRSNTVRLSEQERRDKFHQGWASGYTNPGDYWAGEPAGVDSRGYTLDGAPYPKNWNSATRVEMYWYALYMGITVPYDDEAADCGASGWEAAKQSMDRSSKRKRTTTTTTTTTADAEEMVAVVVPQPLAPVVVPDPSEPRYPREDIGGW